MKPVSAFLVTALLAVCTAACDDGSGNEQDSSTGDATDTATDDGGGYVPEPLGTPTLEEVEPSGSGMGYDVYLDLQSDGQPAAYVVESGTMSSYGDLFLRADDGTWTEINAYEDTFGFALDAGDLPHIVYNYFNTDTMVRTFRFGRYETDAWSSIIVDPDGRVGNDVDMVLGSDTRIHVAYVDVAMTPDMGVKYAVSQTTDFAVEVVDVQETGTYIGDECQIALGAGGTVYVAYVSESTDAVRSIRLATRESDTWTTQDIEVSDCGLSQLELFTNNAGAPQIVCGGSGVYWLHDTGAGWVEDRIVDFNHTLLAACIDVRGTPHVLTSKYSGEMLYTRASGGGWEENSVLPTIFPQQADMVLGSGDLPHIVYKASAGKLQYVHY
jgi:hypothetical protein